MRSTTGIGASSSVESPARASVINLGNGQEAFDYASENEQPTQPMPSVAKVEKPRNESQPRVYPQPKALNGINWNGNGIPIKEFADAKKPNGHLNQFLVIAAWFRLHGNLNSVTLQHIFTAYQMIGWKWEVDKDMAQMFRDGMRPQKRWYESDGKGHYMIGDVGLNAVRKKGGDAKYDVPTSIVENVNANTDGTTEA